MTALAAATSPDAVAAYAARSQRRRRVRVLRRIAILIVILAAWEIAGRNTSRLFIAPFSESIVAMVNPRILGAWTTSLVALLLGFGIAAASGIAIGLAMGRSRFAEQALNPYLTILLTTPMIAIMPIIIVIFGLTLAARMAVVFSFCFVYIAVNTLAGTKAVPRGVAEMASSFRLSEWQKFRWIVLPSAAPFIMTGLRLGYGRAIIGMLVSEMLLLGAGIGGLLIESSNRFATASVLAIVLTLLAASWGGGTLIEAVDRRINRWQRRQA